VHNWLTVRSVEFLAYRARFQHFIIEKPVLLVPSQVGQIRDFIDLLHVEGLKFLGILLGFFHDILLV
jgi:hypothetical protein